MTFGSLFSGIGGLDLGLERAGMTCRWQVENNPFCQEVLAKHWPDTPRYGDIKELDPNDLASVDLICGGFPCQPVSVAGRGRAQEDERWLWPHFARVVRCLRPRYVLVENVPGLLTTQQGRAAQEVFGDLAQLGFDADWASIPAASVGAPHLRYRVLIVAYARGERRQQVAGGAPGDEEADGGGTEEDHVPQRDGEGHRAGDVPDSDCAGCRELRRNCAGPPQFPAPQRRGENVAHAGIFGQEWWPELADGSQWAVEPGMGRVANGVPRRVDRIRGLGNAVVPQVAESVGRLILAAR